MKQKKDKCPRVLEGCTVYLYTCPKLCSLRIQQIPKGLVSPIVTLSILI